MLQRLGAGSALAALLLVVAGPPVAAMPAELLSHRAAYRLSLLQADPSSGITTVRGGLVLEWRAACDGWLSQQRLGFVADAAEGSGLSYDVRFSSWESNDNTQLRFNVRSFEGNKINEEFRGLATLDEPGGKGSVRYSLPEDKRIELPVGTIFPTEHVLQLIEKARAGERVVSHNVFDGSGSSDALTRVTAVIGPTRVTERDGDPEQHWPVNLAYYGVEQEDQEPEFEIAFDLSETGVLRDVRLNYGEFMLKADLEKLETFAKPDCR